MFPYFLALFFVLFIIIYEKKILARKAIILPILILITLSSLRSREVGVDSKTYTLAYVNQYNPYQNGFDKNVEIGYQLLDNIILNFTYNYFWLFFFSSIIVVTLYLHTIKKISSNYFLSVLIYITFGFYTFFFNGLRQGIAMAICFFSLKMFFDRKWFKYFTLVLLASFFHKSALIMILLYFIDIINIKNYYKIIICFVASILGSNFIITFLSKNNQRYEIYAEKSSELGGIYTATFYLLLGILFYYLGFKLKLKDRIYEDSINIYLCGVALIFPLVFMGVDPSGPQRILYYFVCTVIFFIPIVFKKIKNNVIYFLFSLLCIIYYFLITFKLSGLYPYRLNEIFEIF